MEEETKDSVKTSATPPLRDGLLEKLYNFIIEEYEPCFEPGGEVVLMTTGEIYQALQRHYPSIYYSEASIAQFLHSKGFTFINSGKLALEWLLKRRT